MVRRMSEMTMDADPIWMQEQWIPSGHESRLIRIGPDVAKKGNN